MGLGRKRLRPVLAEYHRCKHDRVKRRRTWAPTEILGSPLVCLVIPEAGDACGCSENGRLGNERGARSKKNPDEFQRSFHGSSVLRQRAREMGMRTLREDGVRKILAGMTTPDEVIRATVGDVD